MELLKRAENQVYKEAEKFVVGGLGLIKREEFANASLYFRNLQKARHLGINLSDTPRSYIATNLIDVQTEEKIIAFSLMNSWFNEPIGGKPELVLAEVLFNPNRGAFPSKRLSHELTLICAEEWVHVLQYFKGGSLTGYENSEVDVAAYLVQQGVPLTDSFLSRYGRRDGLLANR